MTAPRINVTLRLAREDIEAVDRLARQDDRSRSQMLRLLVAEAVAARAKLGQLSSGDHDWRRLRELEREFGIREDSE